MTIAIVEQQHNAGLRIMPSGAEDNTSDTTFLPIHFFEPPESFLTECPNAGSSSEHRSVKELLAMW